MGGIYPVTAIAFINPKNNTLFYLLEATLFWKFQLKEHLQNFLQGREIDELDSFEKPTFDMEEIASNSNLESHFVDSNAKVGLQF